MYTNLFEITQSKTKAPAKLSKHHSEADTQHEKNFAQPAEVWQNYKKNGEKKGHVVSFMFDNDGF